MIRDIRLEDVTGDSLEEQIGLPGIYINHYVIQKTLERRGVDVSHMDKTQLHGRQLLAQDDLLEFVQLLDKVASEEWCTNIFMGEVVEANYHKDYASIRKEARERQNKLATQAQAVALFVIELAANGTDRHQAPALVEEFVKKMLLKMAQQDPALADQIFDGKTANGLREVAYLESIGRSNEASRLLREVEADAPGGGYCGAGSCGLESILPGSDEEKLVKNKLGFGDSKDVIKDTERRCKCGAKTVYYDIKQGKKGCTTCEKTKAY